MSDNVVKQHSNSQSYHFQVSCTKTLLKKRAEKCVSIFGSVDREMQVIKPAVYCVAIHSCSFTISVQLDFSTEHEKVIPDLSLALQLLVKTEV